MATVGHSHSPTDNWIWIGGCAACLDNAIDFYWEENGEQDQLDRTRAVVASGGIAPASRNHQEIARRSASGNGGNSAVQAAAKPALGERQREAIVQDYREAYRSAIEEIRSYRRARDYCDRQPDCTSSYSADVYSAVQFARHIRRALTDMGEKVCSMG